MKVILTGGKTGGHIFPLLKIKELIKKNHPHISFDYYGLKDSLEERLCKKDKDINFKILELPSRGFKISNFKIYFTEYRRVLKELKNDSELIVISTGGFVSFPVLLAARRLKIKYILLEENIVMGRVIKLFYKKAYKTCLTFPIPDLKPNNIVITGNPSSQFTINPNEYKLDKNYKHILIIGGSKGSKILSDYAIGLKQILDSKYRIILIAGKTYYDIYSESDEKLKIYEFVDHLYNLMANVDYIISRSGSSTICEALEVEKPLILIPSRSVKDDHQFKNANYLLENNACVILDENNLTAEEISKTIIGLERDIQLKSLMKISQKKIKAKEPANNVYYTLRGLLK